VCVCVVEEVLAVCAEAMWCVCANLVKQATTLKEGRGQPDHEACW
jgi:hypothetical protein